jgi:hypothetical protein
MIYPSPGAITRYPLFNLGRASEPRGTIDVLILLISNLT